MPDANTSPPLGIDLDIQPSTIGLFQRVASSL